MKLAKPVVTTEDLVFAEDTFQWVVDRVYSSGVLAEQLNPYSGESLSSTPLVWSHAVYVETVLLYLQRKRELELAQQDVSESTHTL